MPKEERLWRTLELLDAQGCVTAEQLSRAFYVSLPTIYRDLRELSRRKLVVRSGGHIRRTQPQRVTTPLDFRRNINAQAKAGIAKAAVRLLRDRSTIFMDASTTASYLIEELKDFQELTVLTNGLVTAMLLKQAGIRTYCLGGALVENSLAVGGRSAMELAGRFEIDTMFFSAYGVDASGTIVDPSEEETGLRRYVLRRAGSSVLLCDKSKFGRRSLFNVASLRDVDYLVTDAQFSPEQALVKREVIVV